MPKCVSEHVRAWTAAPATYPARALCGRCRAPVLAAWFDALEIAYDSQSLTPAGELLALLRGTRTFQLCEPHVYRRRADMIRTVPVPAIGIIVREHKCGTPEPTTIEVREVVKPHHYSGELPDF